jgi:magnesium chelatase family protein
MIVAHIYGYHRVLRVARTIPDLASANTVARARVAEALAYRRIGAMR